MIFPNNGKVVVFDDKVEDVKVLLSILSQEKVPYLYYHDELAADLPESPVENVRLVFLDLELVVDSPGKKNLIGPIAQRIKTTLTKNNPYILVYWSTKLNQYKEELEIEFENGLKDYKPIKILSLDKAKAKHEGSSYIKKALEKELEHYSSLNPFMIWESSVNVSAGKITNHLTSIFEKNEKWDKNMYDMFLKLAKAQAGRDVIIGLDKYQLLEIAFDVINSNLIETVEKVFKESVTSIKIEEIKEGGLGMSDDERIKLNTNLHLIRGAHLNHFVQGNLYMWEINGLCREIIEKNILKEKIVELKQETTKLICLDLTPSCDYSQAKNYSRMVYGLMVPKSFVKTNFKKGDYYYSSCPIMEFDNSSYIILDFRCVRSFSRSEFYFKFIDTPRFRLRNSLLLDIQAQLSNHVNRPGIISV